MSFRQDGTAECDLCHNKALPGTPVYAPWPVRADENDNVPQDLFMVCRHCIRSAVSLACTSGPPCWAHAEPLMRRNEMRWYELLDQIIGAETGKRLMDLTGQRGAETRAMVEDLIRDLEKLDNLGDLGMLRDTGEAAREISSEQDGRAAR
jgi:hypothetical protein